MRGLKWVLGTIVAAFVVLVLNYPLLVRQLGGAFDPHAPADPQRSLSPAALELIDRAFADVRTERLRDYHVHVIGTAGGVERTWVNPRLLEWSGLAHRLRGDIYMSSSGITDPMRSDEQYEARLVQLIDAMPRGGRYHLLAFDYHYRPSGVRDVALSEFYTADVHVLELAHRYPDKFEPVISVHPYRADWAAALRRGAAAGARWVKWLPNAQGMDPADPALDEYYRALRSLGLGLLVHVGKEQAVHAPEFQALGNPLRLRRPLELGVKVIMAHAASLGTDADLDNAGRELPSFDLFLRMMAHPEWEGSLFGELSAVTQFNRLPRPLTVLLERSDLHPRLVNGSDYPLPAVNIVIQTRPLVRHGFISPREAELLREIYRHNPLLFDFVLKRTVRHPVTGRGFPPSVFETPSALEPGHPG